MTNQEAIEHIKNIEIYSYQDGYTAEAREALDMAIKALETQELSNNSPELDSEFGDLISRQDAIDALKNRWKKTRNYEGNGDDIAEECELYLKQVPPAQPDVPDSNVVDLISREAISYALNTIKVSKNETWYSFYQKVLNELCKLPSAQPEPCEDAVSRNAIIQKLNTMDRYVSEELILCDTDKKFPKNEVFIVDDVYEEIVENLESARPDSKETSFTHKALDTISRQAAIDALRKREKELRNINWYNNPYAEGECEGISYAMDVIRNTPSAQPYTEAELQKMQDLYQAEIDKAFELGQEDARSEIIHCGECEHRDPEDHKCDCGHDIRWQLPRQDDWYCADAERRTE